MFSTIACVPCHSLKEKNRIMHAKIIYMFSVIVISSVYSFLQYFFTNLKKIFNYFPSLPDYF